MCHISQDCIHEREVHVGQSVLITNLFFEKFTGSELFVLEIAKLFCLKGYDVTIAVFRKAYPLLEQIENSTIRIVECPTETLLEQEFDIVFVQHFPVFDYLCSRYDISYKKLIVSKLSIISELEHLPICTPDADLILCVSEECAEEVRKQIGEDCRITVFKNSVSAEFFDSYNPYHTGTLNKIAVVSNHVAEEVLQISQLLEDDCIVDYIGAQYEPRLVDAELLKEYDLVITIGRTVQQCFALGVPVYVYDYFGGPGYINDDNFEIAEKNHFSGRGGFPRKTSLELKQDIELNYQKNLLNLENLHLIAKRKYDYETNFDEIYQRLFSKDDCLYKRMESHNFSLTTVKDLMRQIVSSGTFVRIIL